MHGFSISSLAVCFIALGALGAFMFVNSGDADQLVAQPVASMVRTPLSTLLYRCVQEQSIKAEFYEASVRLTLSDGRILELPEAASPTGQRYAQGTPRISFWHDRVHAYLEEEGRQPFSRCVENRALEPGAQTNADLSRTQLQEALARGGSQMCTITTRFASTTPATLYVDGLRMRATYQPQTNTDSIVTAYVLSIGEWVYLWSSDSREGSKIGLLALAEEQANARAAGALTEPVAQELLWECNPWSVEETQFVPPRDITFTEMTELSAMIPLLIPL
jgi:membrane-bound inhibitor of C-type lysozyme